MKLQALKALVVFHVTDWVHLYECHLLSDVVLPNTLKHIGYRAFSNCLSLKHITIPGDCFNIDSGEAFYGSGLETISFQEGVSMIPSSAFYMTKIKEIELPNTVRKIDTAAFMGCELEKIQLNKGLEEIAILAFGQNPFTEITIPETVKSISEYAFVKCENFTALKFLGDAPVSFLCDSNLLIERFSKDSPNYTIFYLESATGFTSPEWNGYPTALW